MEEIEGLKDIFVYIKSHLNQNIEKIREIEENKSHDEYGRAKGIEELIPSESFIRGHAGKMIQAGLTEQAKELFKLYNHLCEFTRDTSTISAKYTKRKLPLTISV